MAVATTTNALTATMELIASEGAWTSIQNNSNSNDIWLIWAASAPAAGTTGWKIQPGDGVIAANHGDGDVYAWCPVGDGTVAVNG